MRIMRAPNLIKIISCIYVTIFIAISISSCSNGPKENPRYTQQQIDSLQLDLTKILKSKADSLITIDLNQFLEKKNFDLDSLADEINLIPLETIEASLLDDIYKVIVTDSHIYVYDTFERGGIVVFNKDGKFIRRIANGKGPGELSRLYDIDYDTTKNELVAFQHSYLLFFTPDGEFIRQQKLPLGFYNFMVTDNGYVFKALDDEQANDHLSDLKQYTLMVTDKQFKLRYVGMPTVKTNITYGWYRYLYRGEKSIYVTERFENDTIYQYQSATDDFTARYVLDYNAKKLPANYLNMTWREVEPILNKNDYYFYLGEYLDLESHHVFVLNNHYAGNTTVIRDKNSGNMKGGSILTCNLNEIPFAIGDPKGTSGKYFVSWYTPGENDLFTSNSTIISAEDKLKAKGLTESDNPVLVLYTLKSF